MNIYDIVEGVIKESGADGLVNIETGCGCGSDDLFPCGDGPFNDCQLATRLTIPPSGELRHPETGIPIDIGDSAWVDARRHIGDYWYIPMLENQYK